LSSRKRKEKTKLQLNIFVCLFRPQPEIVQHPRKHAI